MLINKYKTYLFISKGNKLMQNFQAMATQFLMIQIYSNMENITRTLKENTFFQGNLFYMFLLVAIIGMFTVSNTQYDSPAYIFGYVHPFFMEYILGKRRNEVTIEGQREQCFGAYNSYTSIRCNFTDRFKAIWTKINNQIEDFSDVRNISETSNFGTTVENGSKPIFIMNRPKPFLLDKYLDIYGFVILSSGDSNEGAGKEGKTITKVDRYELTIYSYTRSMSEIINFIDQITDTYLKEIENGRQFKKFCYTIQHLKPDHTYDECWSEEEFISSRTFDNMFFEQRDEMLEHIDFFLDNKKWYDDKGIHYTIGFGLHGKPGTGKTSFIKCLANKTQRHIVNISLKVVKTKQQLDQVFFEKIYARLNRNSPICFSDKIIVFEDIDCIGDLVKDREKKKMQETNRNANDIASAIMKEAESTNKLIQACSKSSSGEDPITLDDFLNLLDGVRETPGRIIVITSNCYNELDSALTRPGRIDHTIEMKLVSHSVLQQISKKYYNKHIKKSLINEIDEYLYSPAEIINIFKLYKNDFSGFVKRLQENKRLQ